MKRLTSILILTGIAFGGFSQQSWQLSQYQSNAYLVNPATAGEQRMLDINTSYRQQWLGSQYAPKTYYISATSRIFEPKTVRATTMSTSADYNATGATSGRKVVHALGGIVLKDQFGAFSQTAFGLSYAVHIPLSKSWTMSAALKGSMRNWVFSPSKVQLGQADDPVLSSITTQNQALNTWIPSIDFGLYAYSKYAFVSYATDQLTQGKLKLDNSSIQSTIQRTHYAMVGGRIPISRSATLIPSTLLKYTASAPYSLDLNLKLDVQDRYFVAVGYRLKSDIILSGAVFLNDMIKIGYSYDLPTSKLQSVGFGSHEIFLGIQLFKH